MAAVAWGLLLLSSSTGSWGQIEDPVTWDFQAYQGDEASTVDVVFHAAIDPC